MLTSVFDLVISNILATALTGGALCGHLAQSAKKRKATLFAMILCVQRSLEICQNAC